MTDVQASLEQQLDDLDAVIEDCTDRLIERIRETERQRDRLREALSETIAALRAIGLYSIANHFSPLITGAPISEGQASDLMAAFRKQSHSGNV